MLFKKDDFKQKIRPKYDNDYAVVNGYVEYNSVNSIRLLNNLPRKPRQLPPTEALRIINSHFDSFDLLPFFMLDTGCRKSEALAVRFEDIDIKNRIIRIHAHVIHSGNKAIYEDVLKTERLADALPKVGKGFLFSMNGDGEEPLTEMAFSSRWKNYCKKYEIKITARQLHHAYATMLFEAGIEEKDAQYLMGHSDVNLTRQIYTHIRQERLKQITADKLNKFSF